MTIQSDVSEASVDHDSDLPGASRTSSESPTEKGGGSVPAVTMVLFLIGCAVLVAAAALITELPGWADRWGQIPVFLVFFLVMAIGGRWFWTGVDALIAAFRRQGR